MDNNFLELKLDNYKPLREVVFNSIRGAIISGVLKPGERLMEVQLAEKMGVSRTPIREAIRKLELEGLVVMIARKGAYVADLSIKNITDVLEVRAVLEGLASGLAALRMTEEEIKDLELTARHFEQAMNSNDVEGVIQTDIEFHEKIFKATRNEKLLQLTNSLMEQVQRFRVMYLNKAIKSTNLIKEHYKIVEAISRRNREMAENIAKIHIQNAEKDMMRLLGSSSGKNDNP
ncbi:MAG TPA: GntR family transcriptional regulator [Bacillota bacterium]|nr:GntR family transcriptional regulator [Clostridiaceae bacterium]HNR05513.1 GntR family transcriptional regulator [Bacillota bacterium]HNT04484.1 GntR family transcriptional regulator [Bacillota bacterium]HPX69837.1 GntR family transcriptional regulator [Bacillota bacterium]HQA66113.1 GntR family transcriptional regulator [Bacillota bacterium]